MHKLIQWLRYLIACGFSGMAIGFAVKEQSILGILGVLCCLLPAIGLFLPLTFKVRGQVGFPPPGVPLKELFSWYWILAGCRWFLGLCYCCATLGGLFKHEYPAALTLFAIGLIFITPLDRLFFPRLYFHVKPILRTRRIQILILRNTAIGFHAIAFDQYSQPPYGTSLANFLLCIAAILLAAAAWITPKDLLLPEEEDLSIPALVKTIVKPVANQVEEPVIIQAVSGDSKISQESYQDAYEVLKGLKTSYSFSPERFSKLITAFQTDWLKAKRFRERLNIHRNPIEVKNQTITELETYLLRIQGRSEMRDIDPDTKAQGYVPTRVTDIWMADKRIRSLYDAVKEYCSLQRKDFFITAVHIAEYRAMVKLLKRIRRLVTSQQMAGKQDNFQGAGGERPGEL